MSAETRLRRGDEPKGVQKVFKLTDHELAELQKHIADNPKASAPAPVQGVSPGAQAIPQGESMLQAQINGLKQRIAAIEAQLTVKSPVKKAAKKSA